MRGEEVDKPAVPPVPGIVRLGWMLLMQPYKLHKLLLAWGLEADPSLIKVWARFKAADAVVRSIVLRWAFLALACTPVAVFLTLAIASALGASVTYSYAVSSFAGASALFALSFVLRGMMFGTLCAAVYGVVVPVAMGVSGTLLTTLFSRGGLRIGVEFGVVMGLVFGFGSGIVDVSIAGVRRGFGGWRSHVVIELAVNGLIGGLFGVVTGLFRGLTLGMVVGATCTITGVVAYYWGAFRLATWPAEAIVSALLSQWLRFQPGAASLLVRWLPFRHHELIRVPLPGLRTFLVRLAQLDRDLYRVVEADALEVVAARRAAASASIESIAADLERVGRGLRQIFCALAEVPVEEVNGIWVAVQVKLYDDYGAGGFGDEDMNAPVDVFLSAHRYIFTGGSSQRRRGLALERACKVIERFKERVVIERPTEESSRRLLFVAALWLDIIHEEQQRLAREVAENPEIPPAFIAGSALTPDDADELTLFRGRADIIKLIEHDLSPDRRGVIIVSGQRRMGKTSLRNYLPTYLGTGTTVIISDFQSLSGDPDRATPHRTIVAAISSATPSAPKPPDSIAWGDALRYLKEVDKTLTDHTLLIVIDEVERLEDGIRAGWTTTDFLDFLRAAGDALRRIRFLLLTAYPLHRLGPHWVDRLVSVTSRSISYLDERDARELMVHPIPEFPDIYPEGGVDRILAETGRHPYLLQKVGDELVRHLNSKRSQKATPEDLEKVFDDVINGADLFDELWRQRTEDERTSLRRMAASSEPIEPDAAALQLVREGYVEKRDGKVAIAVPLFREWIRDTQGAG